MGKIPYKARAIYGKLPAMGVHTKYLPGGAFDLYGFWEIKYDTIQVQRCHQYSIFCVDEIWEIIGHENGGYNARASKVNVRNNTLHSCSALSQLKHRFFCVLQDIISSRSASRGKFEHKAN